jgi:hypothetical protein
MLDKTIVTLKTGQEKLSFNGEPLQFSLLDFWRWSVSDILSNATRGILAEFIVATATGINVSNAREEWAAYDLETPERIKLEIKSAAYLQTWFQRALSRISFSTRPAYHWDSGTNKFSETKSRHSDVYVFCLLHHCTKKDVDPLKLDQWEFYVVATRQLDNKGSISLKVLQKMTGPVGYNDLREEIKAKHTAGVGS